MLNVLGLLLGYQEYCLHCQSDSVWRLGCILHISGSVLDCCYVSGGRCAGLYFFLCISLFVGFHFRVGLVPGKYPETSIWGLTYEWVLGTPEMQARWKGIIEYLQTTVLLRAQVKAHDISFAPHVTRKTPLRKLSVISFSVHKAALVQKNPQNPTFKLIH